MLSTYYIAESGSDSYDGLAAVYDGVHGPWKTVEKVNNTSFSAGDSVLFNRGDVWREQLTISSSGSASSPLTFGAYGTGDAPQFNGSDVMTGWTLHDATHNVWVSSVGSSITDISQVFVDGERQNLARWPNTGWNTIDAASPGATSLYDTSLTQQDDYWNGCTAVIRGAAWSIDPVTITDSSNSANTITWGSYLWTGPISSGYGYYIEGKFEELDTASEWYFDDTNDLLYLALPSGETPTSHTIEASTRSSGIYSVAKSYVNITDISVANTLKYGMNIRDGNYNRVSNCIVENVCMYGILGAGTNNTNMVIENNTVQQQDTGCGILVWGVDNSTIQNNEVSDVATDTTSPRYGVGIQTNNSHNCTITENTVTETAGHGIRVKGDSGPATVSHNTISRAVVIVDDNGGIYCGGDQTGSIIENNRIYDIPGSYEGTSYVSSRLSTVGIYFDETDSHGVTIRGNVINDASIGIKLHKSHDASVLNNTLYDNRYASIQLQEDNQNEMYNNVVRNNICYATDSTVTQASLFITRHASSTNSIGVLDNNLYYNPDRNNSIQHRVGSTQTSYTLGQWQGKTGLDSGNDANSLGTDPNLVDIANGDFHLSETSPCIDTGASVGLTEDFDGVAIPQGDAPDIGAYELTGFQYGQWRFDSNLEDSIGSKDGTGTGDISYMDCLGNEALDFDGSGDYVTLPYGNGESSTTSRTYTLWVNADAITATNRICLVQSDWSASNERAYVGYSRESDGKSYWGMGIGSSLYGDTMACEATSGWHLISLVFDGTHANLYVDGEFVYQKSSGNFTFNQKFGLSVAARSAGLTGMARLIKCVSILRH